jgi:hypothetical protein
MNDKLRSRKKIKKNIDGSLEYWLILKRVE